MTSPADALAAALVPALRSGRALPAGALDAFRPTTAEGYAAQGAAVHALGATVGGWKVGFGADGSSTAAPMLAGWMRKSGASVPLPPDRPAILEIEIAFRLARDLPPRPGRPYSQEEVAAAVGAAVCGAEIIAARAGMPSTGAPLPRFIADLQGNAGYVIGSETAHFARIDLKACRITLDIDGDRTHDAVGGHPQGDPWKPIVAWANAQCDTLGGLKAGQLVTTGSLSKPLPLERPCRVSARVEGVGEVAFAFVAGR
jgi:2-keto-4-pentenoate hydratase